MFRSRFSKVKALVLALVVLVGAGGTALLFAEPVAAAKDDFCTTVLLPGTKCSAFDADSIKALIMLIIKTLIGGIGVIGTIGFFICGVQYILARDDEAKVKKAKTRMIEMVIGLLVWGMFWVTLNLVLPSGGKEFKEEVLNNPSGSSVTP